MSSVDELLLEVLDLLQHGPPARSTLGVSPLDRGLKVEHILDVLTEVRRDRLDLLERQVRQGDALLLRDADARPRDVVSLSEGNLRKSQWLSFVIPRRVREGDYLRPCGRGTRRGQSRACRGSNSSSCSRGRPAGKYENPVRIPD